MAAAVDRVTVIFSTVFKDDDDVIIGKVFMQVHHHFLVKKLCLPIDTSGREAFFLVKKKISTELSKLLKPFWPRYTGM